MSVTQPFPDPVESWPALPLEDWEPTCATLHMWTQIVGKVRMAFAPPTNHFWHVTFYVGPRGLRTSPIPYRDFVFEVVFDFVDHNLLVLTSRGEVAMLPLAPRTVADFYRDFMATLRGVGIEVRINTMPQEVPNPIPYDRDTTHDTYDAEFAHRLWRVLLTVDSVFQEFRGRFLGKCSPVHFFWGSFDLAVTRFSGHRAPLRPGADYLTAEAYSHECSSAGWWPGGMTLSGKRVKGPAFYSYCAPEPPGFSRCQVRPDAAFYDSDIGEFLLLYDDVRRLPSPRDALLEFLQSTYEAGADLARWDRSSLEQPPAWPKGGIHAA